jgi:adenosylmethionine-8-amino-7-oxononanoate aminotransferase
MKNKILKKDSKFIWHPFTQEKNSNTPIIVKKAKNEK